ncbi:MAG: hypothetical protein COB02_10415 [Candidatus Cloacimonadota bacterium]|nr:MAG: hypothetical protein COB02_10415 [Candidatus Cloacimonadota bacterium]
MKSCEEITKLVSQALDKKLNISESISVRLHNLICKVCKTNEKQMKFLHKALKILSANQDSCEDISSDAKDRIRQKIEEALILTES